MGHTLKKSPKKKQNTQGVYFVAEGMIVLVLFFLLLFVRFSNHFEKDAVRKPEAIKNADVPTSIRIPGVSKNIPLLSGHYNNGEWELSSRAALYLVNSPLPGENGNMVVYGHNTDTIFGPLVWTKVGDKIVIDTKNKKKYQYKVYSIKIVSPSDVSILNSTADPRLTIFTCTGLFDSQRLVIIGKKI